MFDGRPEWRRLKFEHFERGERKNPQKRKCRHAKEVVYEDMSEQRAYLAAAIGDLDVTIE